MKKIFFFLVCLTVISSRIQTANAQEDQIKENKNDEIIIRKNGNKDVKVTVEMKNDDVLINGKPISEFKDDNVSVLKRKKITWQGDKAFGPGHPGGNSFLFNNADGDGESRPFLGVTTEKDDKGVKITDVSKGSAAEKAGLKEGDVITSIGSKKITDPENLMDVVTAYKPKEEVKIYYERSGKSNATKAILGERKQRSIRSFSYNGEGMPHMDENFLKEFNFEMPAVPGQPFNKFWSNPNKKLGVRIEDAESDSGATITNVEQGSVAEKAGLKKDDLITEIDGKKVKNVDEAREEILGTEKTSYTVKAKRNGSEMSFDIKIPKNQNRQICKIKQVKRDLTRHGHIHGNCSQSTFNTVPYYPFHIFAGCLMRINMRQSLGWRYMCNCLLKANYSVVTAHNLGLIPIPR